MGLTYLQAKVSVRGATGSRDTTSTTEKETVMLLKFSGGKMKAYLKYPIWRKQWMSLITDYEENYQSTMLLNHLVRRALERIIGFENDNNPAL